MKQRKTIQAEDLLNGALVRNSKTGFVYRLGPPKKKNVNCNVVNHCQLLQVKTGEVASEKWFNMSNLRQMGFHFHSQPAAAPVSH